MAVDNRHLKQTTVVAQGNEKMLVRNSPPPSQYIYLRSACLINIWYFNKIIRYFIT